MMRHLPFRRPLTALVAATFLLVAVVGAVAAHAELETPTPANGAVVPGTPPEISGTYSENMDPDGSSLKLVDASGAEIATGGVVPDNAKEMAIDPVPELQPGDYTVESTTKSADDGDIDRTTWSFTVTEAIVSSSPTPPPSASPSVASSSAPPASPSAAPSATPTASASPTPAPSPSADGGSSTGSGGDVLLPILAALVIVAAIGGYLYSRRDRTPPTPPTTPTPPASPPTTLTPPTTPSEPA